jgi:hypothetical protein
MSREEFEKLLGGYATGTLTAEEQQALFAAALEDQALFDALAREQVLRDLLRDPAARATVLAELDSRPAAGWLTWLRRPWVAGLAMAAVAAIAVGVWQLGRKPIQKYDLVAENRLPVAPHVTAPPPAPPPVAQDRAETPQHPTERSMLGARSARVISSAPPSPSSAPSPPPAAAGASLRDKDQAKEQVEVTAQTPVFAEKKSLDQTDQLQVKPQQAPLPSPSQQAVQNQLGASVATPNAPTRDARALFYEPEVPPAGRMGFAPQVEEQSAKTAGGGGGGANAPRTKNSARVSGAAGVMTLGGQVSGALLAPLYPGVRCSIVRGGKEADPSTPLTAGEAVKLKLIPNADGFLYVMEDNKVIASGPVRRLVPFETQELKSDAPAERQFRITLTRAPLAAGTLAKQADVAPANLVETKGEREAATYMVQTGNAASAPHVVLPVTLTWR